MDYKQIESLRLIFSADTEVFLFQGINSELTAGIPGTVLHSDQEGIYVYFKVKVKGSVSTRFFRWSDLASGVLRTKEEWDNINRQATRDQEYTSALIQMKSNINESSTLLYVYGFQNSEMLDEFISMLNRKHWIQVWSPDNSPATAYAVVKFKPVTNAELSITSKVDIQSVIESFRSNIKRLEQLQKQGLRPDVSIRDLQLCSKELGSYLKRHKDLSTRS